MSKTLNDLVPELIYGMSSAEAERAIIKRLQVHEMNIKSSSETLQFLHKFIGVKWVTIIALRSMYVKIQAAEYRGLSAIEIEPEKYSDVAIRDFISFLIRIGNEVTFNNGNLVVTFERGEVKS
jgi:hypothetical protein